MIKTIMMVEEIGEDLKMKDNKNLYGHSQKKIYFRK